MTQPDQMPDMANEHRASGLAELRPIGWVGGALDSYTRLLRQHIPAGQHYFQWYESRALAAWLDSLPAYSALLIGHSYGASTAAKVVAAGHSVAELITLDPVGWRKPDTAGILQYCKHWRNYQAADAQTNFANMVAWCGGQWRQWPKTRAHQHVAVPVDHAQIVAAVLASWRR